MKAPAFSTSVIVISTILLLVAVVRDVRIVEWHGFGDLRNRVVGARLMKDGLNPYSYKWHSKDSTRYFDPWNFAPLKLNNITGSPLLLHALEPIADLPQRKLSYIWLLIEYMSVLLMPLLTLLLPVTKTRRLLCLLAASIFLFTAPWLNHMSFGQSYIFIPLLLLGFFVAVYNFKNSFIRGMVGSFLAIALILLKPPLLVFFAPLLFFTSYFTKKFIAGVFIPIFITVTWLLFDKTEQQHWKEYALHISEHIKMHQNLYPTPQVIEQPIDYAVVEGVDMYRARSFYAYMQKKDMPLVFQTASVYKNFLKVFHRQIPLVWLNILTAGCCLTVLVGYYFKRKKETNEGFLNPFLVGFSLYFIADIFSPIYRAQYSAVAWLFPLVLLCCFTQKTIQKPFVLFATGFLLSIFYFNVNKIQYALGEYMMLIALVWIVFFSNQKAIAE